LSKSIDVKTPGYAAIAKKWKLPVAKVISLVDDGAKVEKEHVKDLSKAKQIARDHIAERPDYYKKLHKMEKTAIKLKEDSTGVTGVRGLGYVSGDPAGSDPVQDYLDTNSMSYIDFNGNILKMIRDKHGKYHKQLGFSEYTPNDIQNDLMPKKSLKEGMSAGPERESDYSIGDPTGSSRKVMKVDEVNLAKVKKVVDKIPKKVKDAAKVGMTLANMATLSQVAGDAAEGRKGVDPKRGIVAATSALPGPVGYGAMGLNYTIKGFDKAREHIKARQKLKEDLRKWFREKWVRYDTKGNIKGPCARDEGEGKPKCRPLASARAMSKDERAKSARRKRREDPVADRSGKGGKPIMVRTEETLLEKNVPTNPALWARAKAQARAKFDVYPSAYANGWASKWYKSKGGGWKSAANESIEEACWDTHKQEGMKKKGGKMVPNCVPKEEKSIVPANTTERGIYEDAMKDAEDKIKAAFTADKVKDMFKRVDKQRDKDPKWVAYKKRKQMKEEQIDEISAELVGKVSNARFWRKETPSPTLNRAITKKFIESGKKKEKKKEDIKEFANTPTNDYTKPYMTQSLVRSQRVSHEHARKPDTIKEPGGGGSVSPNHIREELKMDNKEVINEAIDNLFDGNLNEMKNNLMSALQEKAMEKLEERKKVIAANYFAQD
jgi:hypothetical protein